MPVSVLDFFKIGIGPSSSHTVGPMVAARRFAERLRDTGQLDGTAAVRTELFGALGATGRGHGSDRAVILGLMGETPEGVDVDAIPALVAHLGLNCDPVGGLVQIPCIERNAMASVAAIHAARMALRGDGQHRVSLDEVVETMRSTGADMKTKYKETARGGLALAVHEAPSAFGVHLPEC